jgi:peptidoglycan/LPS O-acetylase OafA/YrhL
MLARLEGLFLRKTSSTHVQFDALDGLRGAAVLLVLLSHLSTVGLHIVPGLDFSGVGKYGVYLFFVLSAFLLTHPFVAGSAAAIADPRAWIRYALRRVTRIFPLYFAVLTANYAATALGPFDAFFRFSREQYFRHLLLQEGKGLYWAIPVEVAYYLVLPFVAILYVAVLRRGVVAGSAATAALVAVALWLWPPAESAINSIHLGPYLPTFLCGSWCALIHARLAAAGGLRGEWARSAAEGLAVCCWVGVAILVPALWTTLSGEPILHRHFQREFLLFGLLWSGVLLGTLNGRGWLDRAFSWKPLRVIGVVSFSIYLWHLPVARGIFLGLKLSPLPLAWTMFGCALGVSLVSYALIERPFLRSAWINRHLRPQPLAAEPAAKRGV